MLATACKNTYDFLVNKEGYGLPATRRLPYADCGLILAQKQALLSTTRGLYCKWTVQMAAENLAEIINSLTPQEQQAVREFIDVLKKKGQPPSSPFLTAVEEFIEQHPELLRRLAQ